MNKEKTIGTKLFGWFFIILSILFLFAYPKTISSYHKLFSLSVDFPEGKIFISPLFGYPILSTLFRFPGFLITGIGILRLKRWAYYIALFIPFLYLMEITINIWLLGIQSIIRPVTFILVIISAAILFYFLKKDTVEQFNADYITKRGKRLTPQKFIFWSLIIVVLVNVLPITLWFLYVNTRYKQYLPIVNLKPKKIEYLVKDSGFISKDCGKRDIFDFSISIPKDWKVVSISKGDSGFGWNLNFINTDSSGPRAFIMLKSSGFGKLLLPMSKALNFNTVYDFEKTINYPNWTPIYLILKTSGIPKNLVSIDEAATLTWKGFVMISKSKDRNIYNGSLYSLKGSQACGIAVLFKDGVITPEQAKSIIASLEFGNVDRKSERLFEKGKNSLSNGNFTSATINFMNALYINEQNPDYAYYLALALFEDVDAAGRKARLGSSKRFLEYAVKLNPDYKEAKELLLSVNKELQKAEQNEKLTPR